MLDRFLRIRTWAKQTVYTGSFSILLDFSTRTVCCVELDYIYEFEFKKREYGNCFPVKNSCIFLIRGHQYFTVVSRAGLRLSMRNIGVLR